LDQEKKGPGRKYRLDNSLDRQNTKVRLRKV
jgi:hypothetical protein